MGQLKRFSTLTIPLHAMYSRCYPEIKTAEKAPFSQHSGVKLLLPITVS